jgi:two-component system phosphate regulon sensor histidine kinase PhoR
LSPFFENLELILNPMVQDRNLALILTLSPDLPRFSCDPFKLEQVFINLVQNSLRYTDQGGITIKCSVDENQLLIEVADTGKGIEPLHLPRIFERFYVADPARNRQQSGTGLGLTIVKHIVLIHNGTIEAFSNPGEGTSFRISLPLQNPEL